MFIHVQVKLVLQVCDSIKRTHTTLYSNSNNAHLLFVVVGTLEVFMALATTTTTETVDLIDELCSHKAG